MDTKTDGLLKKSLHWNIPMGFVIFSTLRPQTPMEKWRFLSPKTMGLWPLKIKKHVRSHGRVFSVITQAFGTWVLDALKTGMHQAWPPERQVGFSLKCFLQIAEKMRGKRLLLDDTNGCERTVKNLRFSRCLVVFSLLNISSTYLLVGEVWLLLRNGHPWPPPRNCLLFLVSKLLALQRWAKPWGVERLRRRFGPLRPAICSQISERESQRWRRGCRNTKPSELCGVFFSFFSKLVVSSVKLDIFPNFRGETKKCLKLPHSFSWNVFLVIFFKASACEVCGRMMLY